MNTYRTTDVQRFTQSQIERKITEAKAKALQKQIDEFDYNFCIYENKVFNLDGYEILPDEDNIVCVLFNGLERRFILNKMIVFLKESGYHKLFRKPKEVKQPIIKQTIIKELLIKEPIIKVSKQATVVKNKICSCGQKMTGKTKCRKCFLESCKATPKRNYTKRGYKTHGGNYGYPRRRIYCSNGRVYESLYQASKEIGINRSSIYQVINNKNNRKTVAGLTFKYAENEPID